MSYTAKEIYEMAMLQSAYELVDSMPAVPTTPILIGTLPPSPPAPAPAPVRRTKLSPAEKAYVSALKAAEKAALKEHKALLKAAEKERKAAVKAAEKARKEATKAAKPKPKAKAT